MELLYRVNESDEILGSVDRDIAHKQEIMHRSAMTFLTRPDGRVLLQRRSQNRETFPDLYDASSTFHVTYGESYEEAATRELMEETGISAPLTYIGKFTHHDSPEHQIVAVFKAVSSDRIKVDPAETASASFYTFVEAGEIVRTQKITPWLRYGWKLFAKSRL